MTTWFDEESTARVLRSLVGLRLEAVRYLVSAGFPPGPDDLVGPVHEIDHGVQFQTADGPVTLLWQLDADCAALSAVAGAGEEDGLTDLIEAVDVTGVPAWRALAGQVVTEVVRAGHRSVEGCPVTTWACRIDLGDHGSVVVALGEVRDGRLTYSSNTVVALFDHEAFGWFRDYDGEPRAWSVPTA